MSQGITRLVFQQHRNHCCHVPAWPAICILPERQCSLAVLSVSTLLSIQICLQVEELGESVRVLQASLEATASQLERVQGEFSIYRANAQSEVGPLQSSAHLLRSNCLACCPRCTEGMQTACKRCSYGMFLVLSACLPLFACT
jgi:hypothetical protein